MYTSGAEVIEGLSKNAVAGLRTGGGRAAWGGLRQFVLAFAPLWLLAYGLWLLAAQGGLLAWLVLLQAALALAAALAFWALLLRQLYHQPSAYALLWPLGMLCYGLIALRAAWLVATGRGVTWKGRAYTG
jgi:hypothetical protein